MGMPAMGQMCSPRSSLVASGRPKRRFRNLPESAIAGWMSCGRELKGNGRRGILSCTEAFRDKCIARVVARGEGEIGDRRRLPRPGVSAIVLWDRYHDAL